MFERPYLKSVKARIEKSRKIVQVILGPHLVGKTTMVNQLLSQLSIPNMYESADAILATNSAWLMQVWKTARLKMKASSVEKYLPIKKGDKIIGVEVKSSISVDNEGIEEFNGKFHPNKMLLVGTSGMPMRNSLKLILKSYFK